MNTLFFEYVYNLYKGVPLWLYEGLFLMFFFGTMLMLAFCGLKKGGRYSLLLLLVEYVFLIVSSTVLLRMSNENQGCNFRPFWSYAAIQKGYVELIPENMMNVVVFVPVGVLLSFVFNGIRRMIIKKWLLILLIGMGISVSIEAMQLFLNRGVSEVDDVMHNTVGCMIGYGIFLMARGAWQRTIEKNWGHKDDV